MYALTHMNNDSTDFLNLERLIKGYLSQVENLKKEIRQQRQIIEDAFENDAVYREHHEKVKEASRLRLQTRNQILNQSNLREIREKLEEMRDKLKEQEATLSDYLLQYQKMTGFSEIEGDDGEIRIIVNVARLIKGSSQPKS